MSTTSDSSAAPTPPIPALALFSLHGSVALVTGAPRGIGQAAAIALAEAGADVVCVLRRTEKAESAGEHTDEKTQDTIAALGVRAYVVYADLEDMADVKTPRIHILVNCAGVQRRHPSVAFPEADWDTVLDVNLKACFLLAQAAGRHFLSFGDGRGGGGGYGRGGKIINFCSLLSYQGGFTVPAYAASKGALMQLTKALSNEWAHANVQVNGVSPGYVRTDMNEALLNNPTRLRQISERIPAGRWAEPRDFAGVTVFLASKASQYLSGELIVVDGGWMGR
ncbi:hypothetical protein PLEOSDRAFT_1062090 [Pleurotus ostreatus PC15]|uniref:2-deoxy-D-gluconate 3-dehydrogenase n=1 Tax=Pleurotus ostreatus (strain PC15) TaxID=1137138 RepID=A0A067P6F2_PLEO1|nr:hypothetical protein PLEOSDRAFT_1062090 [Pleurotus ostreatus PC15]